MSNPGLKVGDYCQDSKGLTGIYTVEGFKGEKVKLRPMVYINNNWSCRGSSCKWLDHKGLDLLTSENLRDFERLARMGVSQS